MIKHLVVGIGHTFRGDDRFGFQVLHWLEKQSLGKNVRMVPHDGEIGTLINLWDNVMDVVLVDAVSSGGSFGTTYYFDLFKEPIPSTFHKYSTHGFGIYEAFELGKVLKKLPKNLCFYGVEGEQFDITDIMSPNMMSTVPIVGQKIYNHIQNFTEKNNA